MWKPWIISLCLLLLLFFPLTGQVVINEIMASNELTCEDEDGDSSDWVELYNAGDEPVNLLGYYLSDDAGELYKWAFPQGIMAPHSFLLVFCSGKNRSGPGTELHTNFKISSEGEEISLLSSNGGIQIISPHTLGPDESLAAFPDGASSFYVTDPGTPFAQNIISPVISFQPKGGFFQNPVNVEIFSSYLSPDYTIRYTLDGSEPKIDSPVFPSHLNIEDRSPFPEVLCEIPTTPDYSDWTEEPTYPGWHAPQGSQPKATVVRCAVFWGETKVSHVYTQSYFIYPEGSSRFSMPVLALSFPSESFFDEDEGIYVPGAHLEEDNIVWSGNYYQEGADWEKEVNVEYFVDGQAVINQISGLRIHGGKTRSAAQKTMKLYARSEYGKKKFEYPFFQAKEQNAYKRLLIRTSMGAWWHTVISDAYAHQLSKGMHFDIQEYQPVIVFLNGEYWGLHELREKIDRFKIGVDHDLDPDNIKVYASWGGVVEGEPDTEYFEFRDGYLAQNDITDPEVYQYVETVFDIENTIDYFFAELFFHNPDWPANNSKMWRSVDFDNRWRWLFYDLDGAFGEHRVEEKNLEQLLSEGELYNNNQAEWSTIVIRTLIKNQTFRQQFIERGKWLLQNQFSPSKMLPLLGQIQETYEPELTDHFNRWSNWLTVPHWRSNVERELRQFIIERTCEIEAQMMDFFGIESFLNCEQDSLPGFVLVPNPTSGELKVNLKTSASGAYLCRIINPLGQVIFEKWILGPEPDVVDVAWLAEGIYYFVLLNPDENGVRSQPFLKY